MNGLEKGRALLVWRALALGSSLLLLISLFLLFRCVFAPDDLAPCAETDRAVEAQAPVPPEESSPKAEVNDPGKASVVEARFELAAFRDLPGWEDDRLVDAIPTFLRSCHALLRRGDHHALDSRGRGGGVGDWRNLCTLAGGLPPGDEAAARELLEAHLVPLAVTYGDESEGLFTGYYEAALHGSRRSSERYTVPLYRRPPELVMVDLGRFREDLLGRRVAGRVSGGALVPFGDRAAIEGGSLAGRGLELLWVDDPVDAFILHVQGSGLVELSNGSRIRVGYDGQNGHPYVSVGKVLVRRGELSQEEVSLQTIREWIGSHPSEATSLLRKNASYVFFRELQTAGPEGALGVTLTAGRSVAVDGVEIPLGAPLWIDAMVPGPGDGDGDRLLRRLVIAQDTGGAIRGPVRVDFFWGHGLEAASRAGRMKHPGRVWLLLPPGVAERLY